MKGISRDLVPSAVAGDLTAGTRLRKRLLDTLAAVERRMTGTDGPARGSAGAASGDAAACGGLRRGSALAWS
ncbi:hypothetical protein [Methylobacterium sp. J-030]|uniref:hypothetical protein n=1 Tax=Methylobacterium sp. J-030 TaxID=2836627 RepID=UPI0028C4BEBB|nr:hypothetical protein [Methylobacterium sp. J-030]